MHLLANPIAPDHLLSSFGLIGLAIILFAECGLLVGFFLPGDTLLLSAGIALAVGTIHTSLAAYLIVAPIAAVLGNVAGYWIGYRAGPVVFDRPNSKMFRPEYVARSEAFFDRFGWITILLGRFVPIVRTVTTVMAGVGKMRFTTYLVASIIGAIVWTDGILLLGHALGHIDFVRSHKGWIDYAVVVVVLLSLVPAGIHYLAGRRRARTGDNE
ncbi:MAG TPA: DedA family protein [Nocardioides sp.]|jgi:membrane-associated protein|uniref:DedA family protein n=1 Tax=Nocardioides sp. TaxID=35761 RepID=UPI002E300E16|nr:DedA family protein [Nocardioides sp.]HEX3930927.1 DedA family protein [Nocardioides sp.]